MRSFNSGGVCTYGLNSQAGYLFGRSQNALRQRSFGRARGMDAPLKRYRDHDSSDSDEDSRPRRTEVQNRFKRMRVSGAPRKTETNSDMTDEEAATPRSTWRAHKAIVPAAAPEGGAKRPLMFSTSAATETELPWKMQRQQEFLAAEPSIEIPNDASCRAMVVFDPYRSMPLAPAPRVDLVEDDTTDASSSESEEEHFVRFEELPADSNEPVDMDID